MSHDKVLIKWLHRGTKEDELPTMSKDSTRESEQNYRQTGRVANKRPNYECE